MYEMNETIIFNTDNGTIKMGTIIGRCYQTIEKVNGETIVNPFYYDVEADGVTYLARQAYTCKTMADL
jgi:hypothetical protein